jgi:hypothetical protein
MADQKLAAVFPSNFVLLDLVNRWRQRGLLPGAGDRRGLSE